MDTSRAADRTSNEMNRFIISPSFKRLYHTADEPVNSFIGEDSPGGVFAYWTGTAIDWFVKVVIRRPRLMEALTDSPIPCRRRG